MGEEFFEEHFQQISPVKKHIFDDRFNLSDSNQLTSPISIHSIHNSIGSRTTFVSFFSLYCEYSEHVSMYLYSFYSEYLLIFFLEVYERNLLSRELSHSQHFLTGYVKIILRIFQGSMKLHT